jgi:hypothetical protein
MSGGYRFEIDASAGPALEGLLYGARQLLVRVRLFDGPGVVDSATGEPAGQPEVFTDLRPEQARDLALGLLQAAKDAETQTLRANWYKEKAAR